MNPQRWKLRDGSVSSLKLCKTDTKTTKACTRGMHISVKFQRRHCAFMALTSFAYNQLDVAVAKCQFEIVHEILDITDL